MQAQYQVIPSVSAPQILHLHFDPPLTKTHHGFTYARHQGWEHRAGPTSPKSTSGTASSSGCCSANGWMTAARGTSHVAARSEEFGIAYVVSRRKRGVELPARAGEWLGGRRRAAANPDLLHDSQSLRVVLAGLRCMSCMVGWTIMLGLPQRLLSVMEFARG